MSKTKDSFSFRSLRYLFDMDGTLYLDNSPLKGAVELISLLKAEEIPFKLVTNNSSESRDRYVERLRVMGFEVGRGQILTSGVATLEYLRREGISSVYLLGTPALEEEFESAGVRLSEKNPQAVVLSFDKTLTYQKLERAHILLRTGIPYIATHPDLVCPTVDGTIPDCGAFMALLETSTSRKPVVIGKPSPLLVEMASDQEDSKDQSTMMIGDRLYTDIEMGKNAGILTGLVLSGEAKREDVESSSTKPDFIFEGVFEILDQIQKEKSSDQS